jgi:hypothetical protein
LTLYLSYLARGLKIKGSKVKRVQLSERRFGGVIVPAAIKAMPPVATVIAYSDRKE